MPIKEDQIVMVSKSRAKHSTESLSDWIRQHCFVGEVQSVFENMITIQVLSESGGVQGQNILDLRMINMQSEGYTISPMTRPKIDFYHGRGLAVRQVSLCH